MPWKIAPKTKDGKQVFCVVNADTGAEMHCHPTRKEALRQQAALYVNKATEDVSDNELLSLLGEHTLRFSFDEGETEPVFEDPEEEDESETDEESEESDDEDSEDNDDGESVQNDEKPPTFLKKVYALLRGKVSREDFDAAVKSARGHAGGVATADKRRLAFEGYSVDYATPTAVAHYPGDGDCGLPKDDERIKYRAATEIGTQCGECMFFREGGRCIIVEGHIDDGGVCDMFSDEDSFEFSDSRQFAQQRQSNGKFGSGGGSSGGKLGKSEPHKLGTDVHLATKGGKTEVHVGGSKAGHVEPGSRGKFVATKPGAKSPVSAHGSKEEALKSVVAHGREQLKNKAKSAYAARKTSELYDMAPSTALHERDSWALFMPFRFAEPPKRYQYLPPPGNFVSGKYGEVMITKERNERFVRNFRDGIYDQKLPIDLEHDFKLSGAAGYVEDLVLNEDFSVDAVPSWNPRGTTMIEQDRFRYFSPEWYDKWVRPEDGKVFYDVAIGGALTTRPFFKEKSLRSLVATEQGLAIIERSDDVSREAPPNDPTPVSMSEVQDQLRQANERLVAQETAHSEQLKQATERIQGLEDNATSHRFSEMVQGKAGEDDGKPWIGPVDTHVKTLVHLAKTAGEESELFQEYLAAQRSAAEIARQSKIFSDIGSDRAIDTTRDAGVEDNLMAQAQKLVDEGKAKTMTEATERVILENPDAYRKAAERHY